MATTTNYGWETPDDTDLVKDGALAMRDLGQDVDTSLFSITGGRNVGLGVQQSYTLSSSSGISVTGLAVGGRYRINGVLTSTSSPIINFRWRENSTDKATSYLWMQTGTNLAGSVLGFAGNPGTEHYVGNCFANAFTMFSHDLTVCSATTGEIIGQFYDSANGRNITTSSVNSGMSNLNGFSIFPSTGTITGNITVYRYA
jgi:hypothetical protein